MMGFSYLILSLYSLLIGRLYWGFGKVPEFKNQDLPPKIGYTVIIPFRNEAAHLTDLLRSFSQLEYDRNRFEIILINDDSNDNSEVIVTNFINTHSELNFRLFQNKRTSNSPKKDAIRLGISESKFAWIITTDADCSPPKTWLSSFNNFIQKHPESKCIVAPVTYFKTPKFLTIFQWFDIMSLQGATLGGFGINRPFLCNGANFAYTKQVFLEVNGFTDNDSIGSGDDIFLLEKISKKHPKNIHYLKSVDAIIYTHAQPTLPDLISQRKRWASKSKAYTNKFSQITGVLVLGMNALWICLLIFTYFGDFSVSNFTFMSFVKFGIDFMLIYKSAVFFNQKNQLIWYPIIAILYPVFCSYVAVASLFTSYTWKDRQFTK